MEGVQRNQGSGKGPREGQRGRSRTWRVQEKGPVYTGTRVQGMVQGKGLGPGNPVSRALSVQGPDSLGKGPGSNGSWVQGSKVFDSRDLSTPSGVQDTEFWFIHGAVSILRTT